MDVLASNYVAEVSALWRVAELLKKRKDAVTGEVRDAYVGVIKDILWQISNYTYTFINAMIENEMTTFTGEEGKAELQRLLARFPPQ